jgi:AcrR family transcriptional regulator
MTGSSVPASGTKRAERTEAAILEATRELIIEVGVRGLTVEGVAARARVAKTTVYRRWKSKEDLALAVLLRSVKQIALADFGNVRDELIAFLNDAIRVLTRSLMGRVMQGLVSDFAANEELGRAFRERVVSVRLTGVRSLVERAIERGELRPDVDVVLVHELLFGPVFYRLLLTGSRLDGRLAERIVDALLPGIVSTRRKAIGAKEARHARDADDQGRSGAGRGAQRGAPVRDGQVQRRA